MHGVTLGHISTTTHHQNKEGYAEWADHLLAAIPFSTIAEIERIFRQAPGN